MGVFAASAGATDPRPCPVREYPSAAARLAWAHPSPQYIVFTADPDPATGQPWCPDCARALPAMRKLVKEAGGTLLEVEVGPREAWKVGHLVKLHMALCCPGNVVCSA